MTQREPHTAPVELQVVVYGTGWCPDVRRTRAHLDTLGVPYRYVDVESDTRAEQRVRALQRGARRVPTVVLPDQRVLVEPPDDVLAAALTALRAKGRT
jgi:glutaredoxin